ncbi:MAG: GGDEF domain-containing protein, partial [Acidobacteriota bacterium]
MGESQEPSLVKEPSHLELAELDPDLVEALHSLLLSGGRNGEELQAGLSRLERRHGNAVYTELLFLLSQVRFAPNEARHHWDCIVSHRARMQERMGKPVDLLVALVSYFVEVQQELKTPVLVELKLLRETRASAYRDELTGLCNYRYFREYLEREILRGERYRPLLSLLMIDIDEFKKYNDRYGHEAGNSALKDIARLLSGSLRNVDVAARYGGEEFALILPSTSKGSAFRVAERARKRIESAAFQVPHSDRTGRLTISIGV